MSLKQKDTHQIYKATAKIDFPKVAQFIDSIISSVATHDMSVVFEEDRYRVSTPLGRALIIPKKASLCLAIETSDRNDLNRLKHALVGPITFIAASENLNVKWAGSEAGTTLPEDLRVLHVAKLKQITKNVRRITFKGSNLARYDRSDQLHCRLIFQPKNTSSPQWPMLDDRGHVVWPKDKKLATRVYTIRNIDADQDILEIDFAFHAASGPATDWARKAELGDVVGILGPAANGVKSADFYVLVGDETGLPAIARILEQLGPDASGIALVEIDGPDEEQNLCRPNGVELRWLYRQGKPPGQTDLLVEALQLITWPADLTQAYFWGGCEHKAFRQIHKILKHDIKLPRDRQTFYSHWHQTLSEEDIIAIGAEAYLP